MKNMTYDYVNDLIEAVSDICEKGESIHSNSMYRLSFSNQVPLSNRTAISEIITAASALYTLKSIKHSTIRDFIEQSIEIILDSDYDLNRLSSSITELAYSTENTNSLPTNRNTTVEEAVAKVIEFVQNEDIETVYILNILSKLSEADQDSKMYTALAALTYKPIDEKCKEQACLELQSNGFSQELLDILCM